MLTGKGRRWPAHQDFSLHEEQVGTLEHHLPLSVPMFSFLRQQFLASLNQQG